MEKVVIDWLISQEVHPSKLLKTFQFDVDFIEEYIRVKKPKKQFWDSLLKYQMHNLSLDFFLKHIENQHVTHNILSHYLYQNSENNKKFLDLTKN